MPSHRGSSYEKDAMDDLLSEYDDPRRYSYDMSNQLSSESSSEYSSGYEKDPVIYSSSEDYDGEESCKRGEVGEEICQEKRRGKGRKKVCQEKRGWDKEEENNLSSAGRLPKFPPFMGSPTKSRRLAVSSPSSSECDSDDQSALNNDIKQVNLLEPPP